MSKLAPIIGAALMVAIGLVVYCCGPKTKPPEAGQACVSGKPEVCRHDKLGDFDCICEE